jgi:type II secretory pathway component GspD/PulD (secretin)
MLCGLQAFGQPPAPPAPPAPAGAEVRPAEAGPTPPAGAAELTGDARALAKAKLHLARAKLAQGSFDAAEALARETAALKLGYRPDEDSPAKVLHDVSAARTDPRALLTAARAALAHKEYSQAEKCARLSEKYASFFTFPVWGDTPAKALKDVAEARKADGAKGLAAKAPADGAPAAPKKPADGAEGNPLVASPPEPAPGAPGHEKKEVGAAAAATPPSSFKDETDKARALLKQARKELQAGKPEEARKLVAQARGLKSNLSWWEDNPDRVSTDIQRAEKSGKKPAGSAVVTASAEGKPGSDVVQADGKPGDKTAPAAPSLPRTKEQAKRLLAQGRQQLDAGKLDEAARTAQRIKAGTAVSWGLFEDSPDRLAIDIDKARARRDREESVRLMTEGRKLFEKGKYDEAARAAYKAQKLHGPYSLWELGDRPTKLLADVHEAQAKQRKLVLPPAAVAKNTSPASKEFGPQALPASFPLPTGGAAPTPGAGAVAQAGPTQPAAGALPAGVIPASVSSHPPASSGSPGGGQNTAPERAVVQASVTPPAGPPVPAGPPPASAVPPGAMPTPRPGDPGVPGAGVAALANMAPAGPPPLPDLPASPTPVAPAGVAAGPQAAPNKLRAQQLTAEAQRLLAEGKIIDARAKIVEAQHLGASFGPDETGPDLVYQEIAREARNRINILVRKANDTAHYSKESPAARYRAATALLTEARTLAGTFGQDCHPVDVALADLRRLQQAADHPAGAPQVAEAAAPAAPTSVGQTLLEKARLELRRGETATARRMTETALTSYPEVKNDAMALLRTIDSEEFNRKRLEAVRAFDAAVSAYHRGEYGQANALVAALDIRLLDADRKVRLREMSLTPEMVAVSGRPAPAGGVVQAGASGGAGGGVQQAGGSGLGANVGRATATDAPDGGQLDGYKARQKVLLDSLRLRGADAQREAAERFRAGQYDDALQVLQDYLAELDGQNKLEPAQAAQLRQPVEGRLSHYRLLKAQKELVTGNLKSRVVGQEKVDAARKREEVKRENVDRLMKDFNNLYRDGKYLEAESVAMKVLDLDPDNGVATAALMMAKRQRAVHDARDVKASREEWSLDALNDAERAPPAQAMRGEAFDKEVWEKARTRQPISPITIKRQNDKEKMIERRLSVPVSVSFDNAPLKSVIDELRNLNGINIDIDEPSLQEQGISVESPISIKLDQVSLKSALNLILQKVHLTHVIKDEVLQITTEEQARGKLVAVTYQVADLVVPVDDFGDVHAGPPALYNRNNQNPTSGTTPMTPGPYSMGGGQPVGNPSGSMLSSASQASPGGPATPSGAPRVVRKAATNTTEEALINLITSTINPKSWAGMGGPGTIEYYPMSYGLVINQAPDIQEQVADLLTALRRLQDQEVAVEVRLISVTEEFFERIGVNFNLNILNNSTKYQPALLNNVGTSNGNLFINQFAPTNGALFGLTPAGTLTSDLNIPVTQSSFFQTVPQFGGYTAGGLTLGLAFLSDIQVFLFMEAVQGDQRANVMQAPKLTLFNGQTATLTVNTEGSFVQGVSVVSLAGGAQYSLVPSIQPTQIGVQLTIQAVISADRRFVRMSLAPNLSNQLPGAIATFPVVVPIFTAFDGTQTGQPVVFTQFIQQPIFTTVSVQTTVAVPDGGTVLLGGLKTLSEARSEYGPPILSKVPYLDRLFKNTGYGRETQSLLIMVTPRIIVQEEEEERQTGYIRPPALTP